mgnify:CR=1 FL=1
MKLGKIVLSLAVIGLLFASCDDSKKKEAEAEEAAKAEQMKMDEKAAMQAEEESKMQADYEANTVAAIAMRNENFSTLVSAVQAAELAETLKSEGPFTVFAPTNEAFNKVPKKTLDNLMKSENKEQLRGLLSYHVVSGEFMAADVIKAIEMIKDAKGNTSKVVTADVDASNGVVHAIDTVLMPKA